MLKVVRAGRQVLSNCLLAEEFYEENVVEYGSTVLVAKIPDRATLFLIEEMARRRNKDYVVVLSRGRPAKNYLELPLRIGKKKLFFKPLSFGDGATSTSLGFYPLRLIHDILYGFPEDLVEKMDFSWLGEEPFFLGLWSYIRKKIKKPLDDTYKWRTLKSMGMLEKLPPFRYDTSGTVISMDVGRISVDRYVVYIDGHLLLYRYENYREYLGLSEERWKETIEAYKSVLSEEHAGREYYFVATVDALSEEFFTALKRYGGKFYLLIKPSPKDYVFDFGMVNAVAEACGWWIRSKRISAPEFMPGTLYPYTVLEYVVRGNPQLKEIDAGEVRSHVPFKVRV